MDRIVIERGRMSVADPLADELLVGGGFALLDLPEGATQNPDGSVTLVLDYPVTLLHRIAGSEAVHAQEVTELLLHRLTGADMRKVLAGGNRMAQVALSRACDMPPARMAILYERLDATDLSAANDVVAALCGFAPGDGLPENATEEGGAITMTLAAPVAPEGFEPRHELVFQRLRGADMIAIGQAKQTLPTAIARALRLPPKEGDALFDAMDAADIMAAQRVVGFLSGSGRKTGR